MVIPLFFPLYPMAPRTNPQNTRRDAIIPGLAYPAPAASVLAEAEMAGPVDKIVGKGLHKFESNIFFKQLFPRI